MVISPLINTIFNTCLGIFVSILTAYITHKIKQSDQEARQYRKEREQKEAADAAQRQLENAARDKLTLGMARTMLLDNYQKCVDKGFYSVSEREVYHKLYEAYKCDHGNGVIEELAQKIVILPTEPPRGGT